RAESVPRAVASLAPISSLLQEPGSLPLAVLISIERPWEDQSQKLLRPHAFGFEYGHGRRSGLRVTRRHPACGHAARALGLARRLADDSDGQRGSGGVARLDASPIGAAARGDRGDTIGRELMANGVAVTFFSGESIAHDQESREVGARVGFEVERRPRMRHRVAETFVAVMRALKEDRVAAFDEFMQPAFRGRAPRERRRTDAFRLAINHAALLA